MNKHDRKYWAAREPEKLVDEVMAQVAQWQNYAGSSTGGLSSMWLRNTMSYYSAIFNSDSWESSLSHVGEQGELVRMVIPRARKLIKQIVNLVTQRRLDFQAVSLSTDINAIQSARIGNALAKQIVDQQDVQKKASLTFEQSCVVGAAFMKACWRTDKGAPYIPKEGEEDPNQSGRVQYSGDIEVSSLNLGQVIYDVRRQVWSEQDCCTVIQTKNRYDLIAQYPELEDQILTLPSARENSNNYWWLHLRGATDDDSIFVYEFYHKPTPALPQGRMAMFGDKKTVFHDGPNLYGDLPVEPMMPEQILNTGFGYPILSDLLPSQEMLDHSYSAIATNQAATAVQQYAAPRGADLEATDVAGMNFLMFNPMPGVEGGGKPIGIQLTQSAPETFKFADMVENQMMKLAQLNNALIGEPSPGVTAGNAIATLTYNALRFMDDYIKSYSLCLEKIMTKSIKYYAKFASEPTLLRMVSKNNRSELKEFTGKDLEPIDHMRLQVQSPMLDTIGGRFDIAEKLMPYGIIKNPQQMYSILSGAPLETLFDDELSENDAVQMEKDRILNGENPMPNMAQDHPKHVRHLSMMLNDRDVLNNPGILNIVTQLIEKHYEMETTMDPVLKAMIRTGVAPQGAPQAPQGGGSPGPVGQSMNGEEATVKPQDVAQSAEAVEPKPIT